MKRFFLAIAVALVSAAAIAGPDEILEHTGPVTDIQFRKKRPMACSQAGVILSGGKSPILIANPAYRVLSLAVPYEGDHFHWYFAGGIPGESGNLSGLRHADGNWNPNLKVADDLVYSLAVYHQSVFLALADGRVIYLENADSKPEIHHHHTAAARSVQVSPNQDFLASSGMDRLVIVSHLKTEAEPIAIQDHTERVDCLVFSPDSKQLASGARDGKVRLHDPTTGKLIRTYSGLAGEVSSLAWGEKPDRLLAGTSKGKIYQLDLTDDSAGEITDWGTESPITALGISPEGKVYAGTLNQIRSVAVSD